MPGLKIRVHQILLNLHTYFLLQLGPVLVVELSVLLLEQVEVGLVAPEGAGLDLELAEDDLLLVCLDPGGGDQVPLAEGWALDCFAHGIRK